MADILSRIQQDAARQDNIDLGQANHDLQWANTFSSTPPPEVLRNRLNLADTMERVINNRLNLATQSDVKALGLLESREKFKEWQQMAPLREELIKARTAATGATERRRAEEAALEADHTANLNRGISDLYRRGVPRNSPEFTDTVADLIANNPHAHPQHILEVGRFLEGETPDQKIESAGKMAAAREKARLELQPPKPTVDEKAAEAGAITKAKLQAANEVNAPTSEMKSLDHERGLYARELAKARERRTQIEKMGLSPEIKKSFTDVADSDVNDYQSKLEEAESQIRARRTQPGDGVKPPETPAAAATPSPAASAEVTATNPKTGEKLVLRNGQWVPLQ